VELFVPLSVLIEWGPKFVIFGTEKSVVYHVILLVLLFPATLGNPPTLHRISKVRHYWLLRLQVAPELTLKPVWKELRSTPLPSVPAFSSEQPPPLPSPLLPCHESTCASNRAFMLSIDSGTVFCGFAGSGIRPAFLNCSMIARGFWLFGCF